MRAEPPDVPSFLCKNRAKVTKALMSVSNRLLQQYGAHPQGPLLALWGLSSRLLPETRICWVITCTSQKKRKKT